MKKVFYYEGVCPFCGEHVIKDSNDSSVLGYAEQKGFYVRIKRVYTYCPRCSSETELQETSRKSLTREKTLEELNPYITTKEIQEAAIKIWNPEEYNLRFERTFYDMRNDCDTNGKDILGDQLVVCIQIKDKLYYQMIGLTYIPNSPKPSSAPLNYVKMKLQRLQNSLPKVEKEEYTFTDEELEPHEYNGVADIF